jgi:hypothetical protein
MKVSKRWLFFRLLCAAGLMAMEAPVPALAQQQGQTADVATAQLLRQLKDQVTTLQTTIDQLRDETSRYRAETQELRAELQAALAQMRPATAPSQAESALEQPGAAAETATAEARIAKLQEQYDLLSGKVDDQYQSKVESASKYRVRLSGLALLNLFENIGAVDNQDVPAFALATVPGAGGSFGGTLRQSQIGLEVFGPTWRGARIRGNLQFDFAGGFPNTDNGVSLGLMRLRTGVMRLDWARTSIVAGQDGPFISPRSPTSLASLALPALSYSGNLWTWVPQLRVEHRIPMAGGSNFTVQAGILDPLTGEEPPSQFNRVPQAGEASRQPSYASRLAWTSANEDRPLSLGFGGYYSRQNWGAGQMIDGWAVTTDASIPISRLFSLTGEFYRGRSLGGLGGGLGQSIVFRGSTIGATARAQGLDSMGGWAQLKFLASSRLEFNVAAGQDNPFISQIRSAAFVDGEGAGTVRNRSILTNFIYHPRSDLLFSLEYRRIQSFKLAPPNHDADQINLVMGVLF